MDEEKKICTDNESDVCEHEMLAQRARTNMPADDIVESMCGAFRVLGEPSRMKILLALMEGEMCVYHIAQAVGGNQSNVSHQLRVLKDNKIVRSRKDGKKRALFGCRRARGEHRADEQGAPTLRIKESVCKKRFS